ncbi:hypothetical protein K6V18_11865 [Ralstonia insidiosa]|uniref:hypothetical protein n=1 Tax=Ralstonia TaxID=48736 RepID=UPI000A70BDA0|nr:MULTISPECIES: hypothetical protein [Ralstonia]MBY4705705.1 hypothetical protein [Ralstonia insidiosa]
MLRPPRLRAAGEGSGWSVSRVVTFGKPGDCGGRALAECYAAHPSDLGVPFSSEGRRGNARKNTKTAEEMMESTPAQQTTDSTRAPLAIATLLQAGFAATYASAYWETVVTGSMSLLTALISLLACLLLYSGVVRHLMGKPAQWSLMLAAVGLAWSFLEWGSGNLCSYPFLLGAVIGTVAWALALKASRRA